jgi:hypothetical protein
VRRVRAARSVPARRHAAFVISAAGVDPRRLDYAPAELAGGAAPGVVAAPPAGSVDAPFPVPADPPVPSHGGFSVRGRARDLGAEGYLYEREGH